jgi:hypothetical protein
MTKAQAFKILGTHDLEELIKLGKELRNKADASEREFMIFLEAFEASDLWRPACSGTWEQFLKLAHVNLCDPARYSRWKTAREELGDSIVTLLGVTASTQALRINDTVARSEALREMSAVVVEQGTVLSAQTTKRIISRYMPSPSRIIAKIDKVDDLKRENAVLRAQVKELESLVAQYREHFGALPKKVTKSSKKAKVRTHA